jgi:hypothetical protein
MYQRNARVGRCCRWLVEERKTRKEGRQFKCTIVDGEKTISNRIPSRFETIVVYTLIGKDSGMHMPRRLGTSSFKRSRTLPFPLIKYSDEDRGPQERGPSQT